MSLGKQLQYLIRFAMKSIQNITRLNMSSYISHELNLYASYQKRVPCHIRYRREYVMLLF